MSSKTFVGFGFCVAGKFDVFFSSKSPFTVKAEESGFFSIPQDVEVTEHMPSEHMLRIHLILEGEMLSSLAKGAEDYFLPVLKSLDKKRSTLRGHPIMSLMRSTLHQILHCPYYGKAMELLSHKLAQLHPFAGSPNYKLKRPDYE